MSKGLKPASNPLFSFGVENVEPQNVEQPKTAPKKNSPNTSKVKKKLPEVKKAPPPPEVVAEQVETIESVEVKTDNNDVTTVQTTTEIVMTNSAALSLNDMVGAVLQRIADQEAENSKKKFGVQKKLKHSDIFTGATIAIRRDYLELIDQLRKNSVLDKYEILDMIIATGLKNINFDE
jgi:hypothetical protein